MRTMMSYRGIIVPAVLLTIHPALAEANGIAVEAVVCGGLGLLTGLMVFLVVAESLFLRLITRKPFGEWVRPVLVANVASLVAGIPVKILGGYLGAQAVRLRMDEFMNLYPMIAFRMVVLYFVVTLLAEGMVLLWLAARGKWSVTRKRIVIGLVLANVLTYSVLAPLHHMATRPIHNVREWTSSAAWAVRPLTTIAFVDDQQRLCTIESDGTGQGVIIGTDVRDYQFVEEDLVLYRDKENQLRLYNQETRETRLLWKSPHPFGMKDVAFSPAGGMAAVLHEDLRSTPTLTLVDVDSASAAATIELPKLSLRPSIVWSTRPNAFFFFDGSTTQTLTVGPDWSLSPTSDALAIQPGYRHLYAESTIWDTDYDHWRRDESFRDLQVNAYPFLTSWMTVKRGDEEITVASGTGYLKMMDHTFTETAILANGREVLFVAGRNIYLLDVETRRVGWLAKGSRMLPLDARRRR